MTDNWDDLFAMAAGAPSEQGSNPNNTSSKPKNSSSTHPKDGDNGGSFKKKRKRMKKQKHHGDDDDNNDKQLSSKYNHCNTTLQSQRKAMLESRMSVENNEWPRWIKLGGSLLLNSEEEDINKNEYSSSLCQGWVEKEQNSDSATKHNGQHGGELHSKNQKVGDYFIEQNNTHLEQQQERLCQHCGKSPLYHSIQIHPNVVTTTSSTTLSSHHSKKKRKKTKVKDNNASFQFLSLYILLRDVRCSSSCCVHNKTTLTNEEEKTYAQVASKKAKSIQYILKNRITHLLPPGEGEILQEKSHLLVMAANAWCSKISSLSRNNKNNSGKSAMLEEKISLLIACDAFYYRLYYLQIVGFIPMTLSFKPNKTLSTNTNHNGAVDYDDDDDAGCAGGKRKDKNSNGDSAVFIPHPAVHFGAPYLSWDVKEGERYFFVFIKKLLQDFKDVVKEKNNDDQKEMRLLQNIMDRYGIFLQGDDTKKEQQQQQQQPCYHPLSTLHRNRRMETLLLFSNTGWTKSCNTIQQIKATLNSTTANTVASRHSSSKQEEKEKVFYDTHETPAPKILKEWRNSSRDMLCSLYAYAALPPNVIQNLVANLCGMNNDNHLMINRIIELGAGTGYMARLFHEEGRENSSSSLQIDAFDIAPTTSDQMIENDALDTNEYHGNTPQFYNISKASSLKSMQHLSPLPSSSDNNDMNNTALLLCYPPPLSNMAMEALQTHMHLGGRVVVHIGEFCGLTGSAAFEKSLVSNFQCIHRYSCLEWGTDAAEVTVWFLKKKNSDTKIGLIQCSNCFQYPATKRCRLIRSVGYCGAQCFEYHKIYREIHLAMNMIQISGGNLGGSEILDFNDPSHFINLELPTAAKSSKKAHDEIAFETSTNGGKKKRRRKKKRN